MKTYGSLYTGTLRYYHKRLFPILEYGWTQETEYPYRKGSGLVFRVPFTTGGYYFGMWRPWTKMKYEDDDEVVSRLNKVMNASVAFPEQQLIEGTIPAGASKTLKDYWKQRDLLERRVQKD